VGTVSWTGAPGLTQVQEKRTLLTRYGFFFFFNKGRRPGRQIFIIQLKYSLHYAVQCPGEKDFGEKKLQDKCQEDELN
jgi:hypothetical protein